MSLIAEYKRIAKLVEQVALLGASVDLQLVPGKHIRFVVNGIDDSEVGTYMGRAVLDLRQEILTRAVELATADAAAALAAAKAEALEIIAQAEALEGKR